MTATDTRSMSDEKTAPPGADDAKEQHPEFIHLHRTDLKQEIIAVWTLVIVLFISRFGAFRFLTQGFLGGLTGDAGLYVWLFKSHLHGLFSRPWFDTKAFYPYSQTLAWSDNFILPGLVGKILTAIGLSPELSYNLIILGATYLSGYCTYRLVFRFTGKLVAGICAGVSFMTLPFVSGMIGHPQLQFTFFIPLGVGALFAFAARFSFWRALQFGLTVTLAFMTTVYYAIFLVLAAVTLYAGLSVLRPRWLSLKGHLIFFGGTILGALPLVFFVPPYIAALSTFGERHLYEPFFFAASALSFLASPPGDLVYGGTSSFSHEEARLFPGFITLLALFPAFLRLCEARPLKRTAYFFAALFGLTFALSILSTLLPESSDVLLRYLTALGLWLALAFFSLLALRMGVLERKLGFTIVTNRALIALFIFLALMSFAVALGPLGNTAVNQWAFGVHRVWYALLPGFDAIRAISRIGVLTAFALSVVLGLMVAHLSSTFVTFRHFALALPLLIVIENFCAGIPVDPETQATTVYQSLATFPHADEAVIVLPWTAEVNSLGEPKSWIEFARRNVNYMLQVLPTGWRLVNGYSGERTKTIRTFPQLLSGFPDARSIDSICSIAGLRYLVYDSKGIPNFDQDAFMSRLNNFADQIKYVDADVDGNYLFELPCRTAVTTFFELLVPSYPRGTVHFDMLSKGLPAGMSSRVLAMSEFNGQEAPVATIDVPGGTDWETMSINVPQTAERVRPFRITFRAPPGKVILIQNTRYEITENRSWLARQFSR